MLYVVVACLALNRTSNAQRDFACHNACMLHAQFDCNPHTLCVIVSLSLSLFHFAGWTRTVRLFLNRLCVCIYPSHNDCVLHGVASATWHDKRGIENVFSMRGILHDNIPRWGELKCGWTRHNSVYGIVYPTRAYLAEMIIMQPHRLSETESNTKQKPDKRNELWCDAARISFGL